MLFVSAARAQETRVLDDFESVSTWSADASTDVTSRLSQVDGADGRALRMDYDFNGRSGYAFVSRDLPLELPENYEISFQVRGETAPNTLEIKFTDASGDNVHWRQVRGWTAPDGWTRFVIKKRQIIWAWGPDPDRTFRGAARLEFVITAGEGGAGHIEIDDLELRELPPELSVAPRPLAEASSADGLNVASRTVDGDLTTAWRSVGAGAQTLMLDLGYEREFGGLTLRWAERLGATHYRLEASSDGRDWRQLARVENGDGGVDWLRTPEASARWLRLSLEEGQGAGGVVGQAGAGQRLDAVAEQAYVLNEVEIEPLAFGASETAFLTAIAGESRRGLYPRGFRGEQPYWTLVGVDGGGGSALIGEDGAIELRRGGPSIEPFVLDNGRLVSWADVQTGQTLLDGYLPVPTVTWTHDEWRLETTAIADGSPDASRIYGRYRLTNTSLRPQTLTLALAARPMQVNGPVQFLSVPGGASPVIQIDWTGSELVLNDAVRVRPMTEPDGLRIAGFDEGADPQSLIATGRRAGPDERWVESDTTGLMAGALLFDVTLAPGEIRTFGFESAMAGGLPERAVTGSVEAAFDTIQDRVAATWREKLDRVDLITPPEGRRIDDTLRSSLAHMLMSRQGPVLQPGTRSYNRTWIRDGAMMAEGLNRLGWVGLSEDYLRWFAPMVFDNGKVPCCADARGADPVPENDSHGEFIFLAAEAYRYGRDEALLREVWPQVQGAIRYMDELRASTRTAEYQTAETRHLFGLLPPTISHEGYSDKPAYSYWDDFWGLLGYRDAIFIAETLGETDAAARFRAAEAEFKTDIMASIEATAAFHSIDWIAGAADRGDFDATSTTIALSPGGLTDELPRALLQGTFDRWWTNFTERRENLQNWRDYTPYELRNVGAMLRLGRREDAMRALDFYFADRRPEAWNGWAEVVGRDLREPRFIGDMPHAWISSDYIRSALDMFAYDEHGTLVLGAGLPAAWFEGAEGVGVRGLHTPYGVLDYHAVRQGNDLVVTIAGDARPYSGFLIAFPAAVLDGAVVRVDGRGVETTPGGLLIPPDAREVRFTR